MGGAWDPDVAFGEGLEMRLATCRACWELWQRVAGGAAWKGEAGSRWRTWGASRRPSCGGGLLTFLSPAAGPEFILQRLARARQAPHLGGTRYSAGSRWGQEFSKVVSFIPPWNLGSGSTGRRQPALVIPWPKNWGQMGALWFGGAGWVLSQGRGRALLATCRMKGG